MNLSFFRSDYFKKIFITYSVSKLLVFITGFLVLGNNFIQIMGTRWDSNIYEDIAENGYLAPKAVVSANIVFSPVYPAFIRILSFILPIVVSAYVVTNLFGYIFLYIIYRYLGLKTALLISIFPVYVLFSTIPYSDDILLTFMSLALFIDSAVTSSIFLSLSVLTFYNIAPTIVAFFLKKWNIIILPILTGMAILLAYFIFFGNPFIYFNIEKEYWDAGFTLPNIQTMFLLNGWFTREPWKFLDFEIPRQLWLIRNYLFLIFYFFGDYLLFKSNLKNKKFLLLYSLLVEIPLLFINGVPAISIPRLLLPAFPIFYGYACLNKNIIYLYAIISIILIPIVTIWQMTAFFS